MTNKIVNSTKVVAPMLTILTTTTSCNNNIDTTKTKKSPNIILIMADDLGYGDLSCFGSTNIATPTLDKMAEEGMRFTDFHSNGSVSSPTRAALMTGRYQQRCGVTGVITAADHRDEGMSLDEVTIAERLGEMGYKCAIYGKWHLGYPVSYNPIHQGFDEFRGYVSGNVDYHSHVDQAGHFDWWKGLELSRDKGYSTDLIANYSVDFIEENNPNKTGQPFFLYIPFETPHGPFQAKYDKPMRKEGSGKYIRSIAKEDVMDIYKDMIETMDTNIGAIMETLKNLDLDDNTMVIFCSDNGGANNLCNGGYRGKKSDVYEGGHRVPGIIRYPEKVKAGSVSDQTVMCMDFFPTFLDLAGDAKPEENVDGVSLRSLIFDGEQLEPRDLFWEFKGVTAMRRANWKMIHRKDKNNEDIYELYNLTTDPAETTDLSASEPTLVKEMADSIIEWTKDVNEGVKKIS